MLIGGILFVVAVAVVFIPVSNRAVRASQHPGVPGSVHEPWTPRAPQLFSAQPRRTPGLVSPEVSLAPSGAGSTGTLAGTSMGIADGPGGSVQLEVLVSVADGRFSAISTPALRSVLVDRPVLFDARSAGVDVLDEVVVSVRSQAVDGETFTQRRVAVRPADT